MKESTYVTSSQIVKQAKGITQSFAVTCKFLTKDDRHRGLESMAKMEAERKKARKKKRGGGERGIERLET